MDAVGAPASAAAPIEVYRDPVYDGATDPIVVRDARGGWWMFYTQRRATHPAPGAGVAWVHGSRIAIARGDDGRTWSYVGTLEPDAAGLTLRDGPPPSSTDRTHWAPEVIFDGDVWRMYLTEIDGVPEEWAGHARRIVEYVSGDLVHWTRRGPIDLGSDAVIDAAVARCPDGRWRLWFKDEAAESTTRVAVSDDLASWQTDGTAIGGRPHEGPVVFPLGGWWWMLTDEWRGMAVYRSSDCVKWMRQGGPDAVILGAVAGDGAEVGAGTAAGAASGSSSTVQFGRHGAVTLVPDGAAGEPEALLYYFTHPEWDGAEISASTSVDHRRSAVFVAGLSVAGDTLHCAR